MTRVSFVMPNRNHAAFLGKSVESMLNQTRPVDQIVIVDDASTDNSLEVIQRLTGSDGRVQVVRNATRQGVVASLNRGLSEATGDYVAFLGADDFVFPRFVEATLALLGRHGAAAFASGAAEIWNEHEQRTGTRPIITPLARPGYVSPSRFRRLLLKGDNFFLGTVTLYRRGAVAELGGFDASLGAMCDGVLARRLAARHGFCFTPERLGVWRIHGQNYSVTSAESGERNEAALQASLQTLRREPPGLFPANYPELLTRRQRFGAARLAARRAAAGSEAERRQLVSVIGGGWLDRAMVGLGRIGGRAGQICLLAWLAFRFRPFSLSWLLRSQATHLKHGHSSRLREAEK